MKGITVILYDKVSAGVDRFNHEIFEEIPVEVENVLVAPISSAGEDIVTDVSMAGKRDLYMLGIPKGDTHVWDDRTVEFFGAKWKTVGFSKVGIEYLIPLQWNRKVTVERFG